MTSAPHRNALRRAVVLDLALATVSLKHQTAYRANWLAGVFTSGLALMVGLAVWGRLIGGGELGGYDWDAMKAYLIIGFVTSTLAWSGSDERIAQRILDGQVAIDLIKPVDFQRAKAAEYLGSMVASVPAAVVGSVAAYLVFQPSPPKSAAAAVLTAMSLLMLFPLAFALDYLAVLACFWTTRYLSVKWAQDGLVIFLSGMMIPLALMPVWLETLAWVLPFVHFTTTPAVIYLGRVETLGAVGLIAAEVAWTAALWAIGRRFWRHQIKRVTVHGG